MNQVPKRVAELPVGAVPAGQPDQAQGNEK